MAFRRTTDDDPRRRRAEKLVLLTLGVITLIYIAAILLLDADVILPLG